MADHDCDLLIIGAGPTGLFGAYYAGFRKFRTIVMDTLPEIGGQVTAMYPEKLIYDVAGFPAVRGRGLIEGLWQQAQSANPRLLLGQQATTLASYPEAVKVTTHDGTVIDARAVLIAGGIGSFAPRPLPTGQEWEGRGLVYFVPRLEAHRDHHVVIVGGGDSAFDWALALHPIAASVTIVHRRGAFRAHESTVEKVRDLGVRLVTNAEVEAIEGTNTIEKVTVASKDGHRETLPADSVVAALGFIANIGPMTDWGLDLEKRRIVVDSTMATNLPRVFAAGDITAYPGKVALIATGFGEAATAVNNAAPLINPSIGIFPGHSSGE